MSDTIISGTACDNQVRFFAATTRELVEEGRRAHNLSPVACAALGRLMTAGAMMGAMCKNDSDILTLQIQCEGPIGGLTVTADSHADVKGYVLHPDVMLPPNAKGKLDVGGALGQGTLRVIKDIGVKEPYVGQIALVSGEIAEDLTYYFATSEQIPTSIALGVLMEKDNTVKQAGGFIVQLMPYASEDVICLLEDRLQPFSSVTHYLNNGCSPEDLMGILFADVDYKINRILPTRFHCNCSKEYVAKAVISLGKTELKRMVDEQEPIEVNCQFCNSHYHYSVDELTQMLKQA